MPQADPAHAVPVRLQVTPLLAVSLTTVAVMLADLLSSIVCADEKAFTEIGGDCPPPHPKLLTARTITPNVAIGDTQFFDLIAGLSF